MNVSPKWIGSKGKVKYEMCLVLFQFFSYKCGSKLEDSICRNFPKCFHVTTLFLASLWSLFTSTELGIQIQTQAEQKCSQFIIWLHVPYHCLIGRLNAAQDCVFLWTETGGTLTQSKGPETQAENPPKNYISSNTPQRFIGRTRPSLVSFHEYHTWAMSARVTALRCWHQRPSLSLVWSWWSLDLGWQ